MYRVLPSALACCFERCATWLAGGAQVVLRKLFERLGSTYIKLGQFVASSPTLCAQALHSRFLHFRWYLCRILRKGMWAKDRCTDTASFYGAT